MIHRLPVFLFTAFLATACQLAQTQTAPAPSGPQVVLVPPDELTRSPSLPQHSFQQPAAATNAAALPAQVAKLEAPVASSPAKHAYNSCNVAGPYIAMTFDDGPHPDLTPKLLDMLKERGIKATFYVIGKNVETYPEIANRIVSEGHEIGNHSWTHPALSKISATKVKNELDQTTQAIVTATGKRPPTMRPPYGATNATLNRTIDEQFGMKVIMWSVDPQDWKYRDSERVAAQIIENTKPGSIVLAHDIHKTTVAAMPKTLDALKAKGFQFVTVSELLAMDLPIEVAKKEASPSSAPAN